MHFLNLGYYPYACSGRQICSFLSLPICFGIFSGVCIFSSSFLLFFESFFYFIFFFPLSMGLTRFCLMGIYSIWDRTFIWRCLEKTFFFYERHRISFKQSCKVIQDCVGVAPFFKRSLNPKMSASFLTPTDSLLISSRGASNIPSSVRYSLFVSFAYVFFSLSFLSCISIY